MVICEKVTLFVCFFLFLGYIITHIPNLSSVWGKIFLRFSRFFFGAERGGLCAAHVSQKEAASARRTYRKKRRPLRGVGGAGKPARKTQSAPFTETSMSASMPEGMSPTFASYALGSLR